MTGRARKPALLAAAAALALACASASEPPATPHTEGLSPQIAEVARSFRSDRVDPLLLVAGARIFDERCSPCHGERGDGDGVLAEMLPIRPRNYQVDPFKWGTSPREIVATIQGGRSGVMPAFAEALSEQEMWAVAYLVWHWIPPERRSLEPTAARR